MRFPEETLPPMRIFGVFFVRVFLIAGAFILKESKSSSAFLDLGDSTMLLTITLLNAELTKPRNKLRL